MGRKTPQADQLLKKRQKCKKQPVVTPGGGGMAHLITQVAHFPHRPLLPLHSGLWFSADQASSWGRAADEQLRRRGCPGVLWVAAGPGVYTVAGVSSGEGKPGDCVTTPTPGRRKGVPPGAPGQQLSPQAPRALLLLPPVRSSLLIMVTLRLRGSGERYEEGAKEQRRGARPYREELVCWKFPRWS